MIKSFSIAMLFAITAFGPAIPEAKADPIIDGGLLIGATNIDVGGTLYDVSFVFDTCNNVFNPCDDTSVTGGFDFRNEPDAELAGAALLDQVFVEAFDTDPGLTIGCGSGSELCQIYIPYDGSDDAGFLAIEVLNGITDDSFSIVALLNSFGEDLPNAELLFAKFSIPTTDTDGGSSTDVPEPASLLLFGVGLAGLAGIRRRRQRR